MADLIRVNLVYQRHVTCIVMPCYHGCAPNEYTVTFTGEITDRDLLNELTRLSQSTKGILQAVAALHGNGEKLEKLGKVLIFKDNWLGRKDSLLIIVNAEQNFRERTKIAVKKHGLQLLLEIDLACKSV